MPAERKKPNAKQDGVAYGAALRHLNDAENIIKERSAEMTHSQLLVLADVALQVVRDAHAIAVDKAAER